MQAALFHLLKFVGILGFVAAKILTSFELKPYWRKKQGLKLNCC